MGGRGVIRLSNGEGIVNEKAMQQIGSDGLARINRGFADGGTPGRPFIEAAPRASSASSEKTHTINLVLGGNTYPVEAKESVAESFVQEAINWQIASGGKRQSSIS
jgi:hypothetical protein